MSKSQVSIKIYTSFFLIAFCFVAAIAGINGSVSASVWSVVPPLLAISVAFLSGSLSLSLGSAVLLGSFLHHFGESQSLIASGVGVVSSTLGYVYGAGTTKSNLQILGFVFCVLSMVQLITVGGGFVGLVQTLRKAVVGPRSAQLMTAILGCLIFIDDYANTMIVGTTMKKLTDRFQVSREKLAFIVDATSAPIAGVALVSTWIGYEVGLFSEMASKYSWSVDGYSIFLNALSFRFYCYLMIFFVFVNIILGVDFGPMAKARPISEEGSQDDSTFVGPAWTALLPLVTLVGLVFSLLWFDGGGARYNPLLIDHWRQVLTASQNGIFILLISSVISYSLTVVLTLGWCQVGISRWFIAIQESLRSAGLPIVILLLAWSLKLVCDDLKTGEFVVSLLGDRVQTHWLPIAIFLVSGLTAFATGTSWGTMAILIPTITPLALELSNGEYSAFVVLCLASILDGAIMGDHCSPISDTTIMSCISTDCDLMSHVRTQLPYSIVVGLLALFFGYLPAGLGWSSGPPLLVAAILIVIGFSLLKWRKKIGGVLL